LLADSILDGLNEEQRSAVQTTEGPLLVLAGAGSGKTRVLTSRIAYLIGVCGIPADGILAVTFTNKAAGEMKERVEKLLGPQAESLWIGTFHSICVRLLRREIHHLQRSRGFVIYDDADSLGVCKEVVRRHGLDPKTHDPRRLRWRIDEWKNQGLRPEQAATQANDLDDELYSELYATYQRLLVEAEALDFGDLLLMTVELFRTHPAVLEYYQRRWQYVLVDEYQDTNRPQYNLVNMLAREHRNLCVVGDPDQSIYAWRGADVRNILDFEHDHEDARVVKLERNYRSSLPILKGATAVVANNVDRLEKTMVTDREAGEPIRLFEADDDRQEAVYVVRQILASSRDDHRSLGDFAILYRTNAQSRAFEEELLKYDVAYQMVGGQRFYERAEIKDVLAYLRVLVNPADTQSLQRVVNKPTRGIGRTTVERALDLAARAGVTLMEALRAVAEGAQGSRANPKVRAFVELVDALQAELDRGSIDQLIAKVLERTGYLRALEADGGMDAENRVENLKELIASAEDFHQANREILADEERSEVELFLDQVALVSDLDGYESRSERVSLMTIHSAKGLEFPFVFLVGLEEGIFPHASSSRDPEGLEEERRLCYVAMTRAMEQLVLTCAGERRRYGSRSLQTPSRFLDEVPSELVETVRTRMRRRPPSESAQRAMRRPRSEDLDYSYSQEPAEGSPVGMRVRHPVFGTGTVLTATGEGLNQKLKIRFDRVGIKTVVVRFANLEPA